MHAQSRVNSETLYSPRGCRGVARASFRLLATWSKGGRGRGNVDDNNGSVRNL